MPTQPFKLQVTADERGRIVEERAVPLPMGVLRIKGVWVRVTATAAHPAPREHRVVLSLNGQAVTPDITLRDGERREVTLAVTIRKGDRAGLACEGFAPHESLGVEGGVEYNLSLFG